MKTPAFGPPAFALALLLFVSPAIAQYIYLDTNGDGVHTAADVLHAVGPTVADIWLDIGHNRDGTETFCKSTPPTPLDMFLYVADLIASDGTVTYSAYTSRLSQMSGVGAPPPSDDTRFSTGLFDAPVGVRLPAGRYLLGTLTIEAASGTPSVRFATYSDPGFNDPTVFGTYCKFGLEAPNSLLYGIDWLDADGLSFSAGGSQDQPPALSATADMTVPVGEVQTQGITATDAEGQALTFSKIAGPPFMFVATTDQGAGLAHGEIRLAPVGSDIGTSTGGVSVSDGSASDQATFAVTVVPSPNHAPIIFPSLPLTMPAGGIMRVLVSGGDADGGALQLRKAAGPRYVDLRILAGGLGGAVGLLTASPTLCDIGSATVSISASDGVSSTQRDIGLNVVPPSVLPDSVPHHTADPSVSSAVGLGDLNGDGIVDLVTTHESTSSVLVYFGSGEGTFQPPISYQAQTRAAAPTLVDLNQDGHLDLIVANRSGSTVSVFVGRGDGTLLPPTAYDTGNGPSGIIAADFNRDQITDLLVDNQAAGTISVLLGRGDGTFAPKRDAPAGIQPNSPVIADFNLDGRLDVAVANGVPGSVGSYITVLLGLGDGNFGGALRTAIPGVSFPISLTSGDWDSDGYLDLAFPDLYNASVRTLRGHGDGTFDPPITVGGPSDVDFPYESAAADLNADGNTDLLIADPGVGRVAVFLGNGSGGFAPASFLASPGVSPRYVSVGDLNRDGRPDVIAATAADVTVFLNRFGPATPAAEARAFVQGNRTLPAAAGDGDVCIFLEPLHGSYTTDQLNFASVTLSSEGTGSVSEIHCVPAKRIVEADRDGNGVAEVGTFFSREDVARLFDQVHGRTTASAELAGSLTDGRAFCADLALTVVGTGHPPHTAEFAPNPLNPSSNLSFTTEREGPASALLFDIHGRLVRTIVSSTRLPAGQHEFTFDGRTDRGAQLSSGVYFYRVESVDGRSEGRVVILK